LRIAEKPGKEPESERKGRGERDGRAQERKQNKSYRIFQEETVGTVN